MTTAAMTKDEEPPDVMICGLPSLEIADAATAYATRHSVPIALDCREHFKGVMFLQQAEFEVLAERRGEHIT